MRIILVQLPFPLLPEEPRHLSPPIGLMYMGAVLEASSHTVEILDAVLEGYDKNWRLSTETMAYGMEPSEIANRIAMVGPDIIGLSCLFSTQDEILHRTAGAIKARLPGVPVVAGGTHATVFADALVRDGVLDFVIRGEGEFALLQLIEALEGQRSFRDVSGLSMCFEGDVLENNLTRIQDLDALPQPAYHLVDLYKYADVGVMHGESGSNDRAATLVTSRGCPANCTFCSIHPLWGHRFRGRSPERVLDEIRYLYEEYSVRHLLIEDDNFTWDARRARAILQGMIDSWPDLGWSAPNGVAVWRLDDELLELIAESGCKRLSLAVESGCMRTLKHVINKPLDLDRVNRVVATCRRLGIRTTAFFVIGTPGETQADMIESMKYARNLKVDTLSVMIAAPLPGSPLYQEALSKGWIDETAPFTAYTTRSSILTTNDIDPEQVNRLARRTMVLHALRRPQGYFFRTIEKIKTSPMSTIKSLAKSMVASLKPGV